MRKTVVLSTFALVAAIIVGAAALLFRPLSADAAGSTLAPAADAYVNARYPSANYGSSTELRVDNSPVVHSYLRFNIPAGTGPIVKAVLRIYANSASSTGYTVSRVSNNTWSETGITYSNAPAIGTAVRASGAVRRNSWTSVDVTPYVTGPGMYSFALTTPSSTALSLASREATNKPQLVLTLGSTATSTPIATATVPPPAATSTATVLPSTATPNANYQPAAPIRAAFFYPWFPEAWTQHSIFPYTNYHPSLGWYSSKDDAIIDQQLALARKSLLDVFISSWWGQGHHTDAALQYILPRSTRAGSPYPNLRWAIYYENESQGDPSAAQLTSDLQYLAGKVFSQPGYLRVNGRPVVFVYADANDACGMVDRWAQAKQAMGGNVYVVLKVFVGYLNCAKQPDSWHQYSPAVGYDQQGVRSAAVSPGFWLVGQSARLSRDPVRFESDVRKMVASGAFWQLITTWNEWGEGTAVEPATEWGSTYLDILSRNLPAR